MPELPEVEIVRRGLAPALMGKRVLSVSLNRPDLRFPLPERFRERMAGRRIAALSRRAKYILAALSEGETLIIHLGMTGRFTIAAAPESSPFALGEYVYDTGLDPKHDHVVFHIEGGGSATYNDPRRFGFMLLARDSGLATHPLFAALGPEPFDAGFDASYLAGRAAGRTANLKTFLMDQRIVAGLGNIYVSEALHRACLSPNRAASSLARTNGKPAASAERLVASIRSTLEDALTAGGSTLRDYRQTDGAKGQFQNSFFVYAREGAQCLRPGCRGVIRRCVDAGRSTFFCAGCQK